VSRTGRRKALGVKTILIIVGVIALAFAAGAGGWFLYQQLHKDSKIISSTSIRESIVPVVQLTTYDYNFTQILYLSDSNQFLGVNIPFTDKTYIATVDGNTTIGLDASQISCTTQADDKGNVTEVAVSMPHSTVQDVTIDNNSLKKYEERTGSFLVQVTTDDLNQLLAQTQDEQRQKVEDSDLLIQSDTRAQQLIENQVKALCGDNVQVDFTYLDS
jgi:hypothetical protein